MKDLNGNEKFCLGIKLKLSAEITKTRTEIKIQSK